jgi:hypothetical protein
MATPNPYDLEQDAFVRQMGGNNTTMGGAKGAKDTSAYGALTPSPQTTAPDLGGGNSQATRDALGGYAGVGQMGGFRQDDYGGDVKARNSMKNTFGRIASRYGANRQGLESLMGDADFQRYFPNARLGADNGRGGLIDFGGLLSDFESGTPVGLVDVLKAYDGENADEWQWGDQNFVGAQGGGGMDANMAPPSDLMQAITAGGGLTGNDTLEKIQKELQALINGQPSNVSQDAFSQAMR